MCLFLVLRVQRELKQPERAARNNIHVSAQVACPAERSVWDQTTALLCTVGTERSTVLFGFRPD